MNKVLVVALSIVAFMFAATLTVVVIDEIQRQAALAELEQWAEEAEASASAAEASSKAELERLEKEADAELRCITENPEVIDVKTECEAYK